MQVVLNLKVEAAKVSVDGTLKGLPVAAKEHGVRTTHRGPRRLVAARPTSSVPLQGQLDKELKRVKDLEVKLGNELNSLKKVQESCDLALKENAEIKVIQYM